MSIKQRRRGGNYIATFTVDGQTFVRSTRTTDRRLAEKIEADWIVAARRDAHRRSMGLPPLGSFGKEKTFKEALHRWQEEGAPYESMIGHIRIVEKKLGDVPLSQVPKEASEFARGMLALGKSRLTVNRRLSVVRSVLNAAFKRWDWLDQPLGQKVQLYSEKGTAREVFLSREQVNLLLGCIESGIVRDIIIVAAYTGMRRGEILALRPEHIRGDEIHLPAEITKSSKARVIPMVSDVKEIVLNRVPFLCTKGDLRWQFERGRRKAGLSHVRFHDLRHSFASWLASNPEVPMSAIRDLLGHSSLAVTNRYSHLRTDVLKNAINTLEG